MLSAIARAPVALAGRRRGGRGPQVLFEFFGAEGSPDVVFLEFDEVEVARRESLGLCPVLGYRAIAILLALAERPCSVAELAAAAGVGVAYLKRSLLPELEEGGWVRREGGAWVSPHPIRPLARWILAVEAKRRDWRRATEQAERYRRFANRTVVVLDAAANLEAAQAHVEARGAVGLVSLDVEGGRLRPLVVPKWHRASRARDFVWAGEQAYDMRRRRVTSGPVPLVFGRLLVATDGRDPRLVEPVDE